MISQCDLALFWITFPLIIKITIELFKNRLLKYANVNEKCK